MKITLRKDAWFVDLYVRVSNTVAISMYKSLGYTVYRTVLEYYSGDPDEDAYGMLIILFIIIVTLKIQVIKNYYISIKKFIYRYEKSTFARHR